MAVGTALAIGGGILGAISGGAGDESSTTRNVAPASGRELEAQNASWQNYLQQQNLANQAEQGISEGQPLQSQARTTLQSILGGGSFNVSPEEKRQIDTLRQSLIEQGGSDVQNFLNQNLQKVSASAADRGVRGQALSQLQTGALDTAGQQMGDIVRAANTQAAQQSMQIPMQRVQMQGGFANQNANFMENLRNQAIQNRQQLQNPALMNTMQAERLASAGTTTQSGGGVGGAISGAMAGAGGLLGAVGGAKKAGLFFEGGRASEADRNWNQQDKKKFEQGYNNPQDPIIVALRKLFSGDKMADNNGYAQGGRVEGTAMVPGDHPANDTVDAKLSPEEIVIPRSFAVDPKLAKAFIDYQFRKEKGQA